MEKKSKTTLQKCAIVLREFLPIVAATMLMTSCETMPVTNDDSDSVQLTFFATTADKAATRTTVNIGDYFTKLNVMLFDSQGNKAFDKVKTQTADDENFGTLNIGLKPGTYKVVAVGHSSIKSATIKSTDMVQFTASDGEKLTDTFCHYGSVTIDKEHHNFSLSMNRVAAMIRFQFTDTDIPQTFSNVKIDYTGGSANFNPSTSQGCTKSSQSELRAKASEYQVFTFPYLAQSCTLKMTVSGLDESGNVLRQRVFEDVPVTRNRITTYTGKFFEPGDGDITMTGFGLTVNNEWDGEIKYTF